LHYDKIIFMNNLVYKVGEFAKLIGRTVSTLQRWDRDGTLVAHRTEGNRRFYTHEQYLYVKFKDIRSEGKGEVIGYIRVLNENNRPLFEYQHMFILQYCIDQNISINQWFYEIGTLYENRKYFNELYQMIAVGDVSLLIFATKDRLLRHGFETFSDLCKLHGTTLINVSDFRNVDLELASPKEEETLDMIELLPYYKRMNKKAVIEKIKDL
jgi:putative resolvase